MVQKLKIGNTETILNLFHDADANKNGLLDIKEFEAIVNKSVEPRY